MLDVGCGDGTLTRLVMHHRPGLEASGLEVQARPSTAIPVREFDGRLLPCADASYDVVMMVDVLHHSADPHILLREAGRVARHAVILKDHLADPWLGNQRLRAMDWVGNIGHGVALRYNYWTRGEWEAAFVQAGLRETGRREGLGLYIGPFRWMFDAGLHFVGKLTSRPPGS